MKKARMNILHFRFILFNLKIFGEIVTTFSQHYHKITTDTWTQQFATMFCLAGHITLLSRYQ